MKRILTIAFGATILFISSNLFVSCKGAPEHPGQIGNRQKLDIFHQRKQVR